MKMNMIKEGTLSKWLVKEGDTVESGDVMAEIETDKATMEILGFSICMKLNANAVRKVIGFKLT